MNQQRNRASPPRSSPQRSNSSRRPIAKEPSSSPLTVPTNSTTKDSSRWYRIDLHIHTPASSDYQQSLPNNSLDILRVAAGQKLDIIALTDHNSVSGYAAMQREMAELAFLESLKRTTAQEASMLAEYRDLRNRVLVLPGFELTATLGFHILAIFPPETSIRQMEHLLLSLHVPESKLGSGEVGATTDVLTAYRMLDQASAIVIGAHANSSNGVAMRGVRFGGQTRIAFTQDIHLHALELTDLQTVGSRRNSSRDWDGSRPGYTRRMQLVQGSDAHRLLRDEQRPTNLGIGDRVTEVWLPERSFTALSDLIKSERFNHVRPAPVAPAAGQEILDARVSGTNAQLSFHEQLFTRRDGFKPVVFDIAAMANGDGGKIFIGLSENTRRPPQGIDDPQAAITKLASEAVDSIEPDPAITVSTQLVKGKTILVVDIAPGTDRPYLLTEGGLFVRRGGKSVPANREETLRLMQPAVGTSGVAAKPASSKVPAKSASRAGASRGSEIVVQPLPLPPSQRIEPPTGVEIVSVTEVDGTRRYDLRDLRSGEVTSGVELKSARGLWRYAIQQRETREIQPKHVKWKGDYGYWKGYRHRSGEQRHNLAIRNGATMRIFYGVSEDGLADQWRNVLPAPRNTPSTSPALLKE